MIVHINKDKNTQVCLCQSCGHSQLLPIALYFQVIKIHLCILCFHQNITMDFKQKDFNKTPQKHTLFYYINVFHKLWKFITSCLTQLPLQEHIFFRKILPGFNFASVNFPQNNFTQISKILLRYNISIITHM